MTNTVTVCRYNLLVMDTPLRLIIKTNIVVRTSHYGLACHIRSVVISGPLTINCG